MQTLCLGNNALIKLLIKGIYMPSDSFDVCLKHDINIHIYIHTHTHTRWKPHVSGKAEEWPVWNSHACVS